MRAGILLVFVGLFITAQLPAQHVLKLSDSTNIPIFQLEEVAIRSSRENVEIQKLPVSVTSIQSKTIENEQITTATELSSRVPNLFMPDYGSKLTSPVYIRGIGSRINSPSVGLYVDGVPYFEKAAFSFEFFDVDRIEVLRGPQGTLYGRNTMGGIINIYTKKPGNLRSTNVKFYGGNYNYFKAHVAHDQPLGDHLSLGVYGLFNRNDGYFTNAFTNEKVDQLESFSGRTRLVYNPDNAWEAEYTLGVEISNQGGYPYAIISETDTSVNPISYNDYSFYDRDLLSQNFNVSYKTDKMEFRSVTSHQYLDGYQEIDQDFTPASLLLVSQDESQHMISQEFNLQNKLENYTAVTGLFGFLQYADKIVDVEYGEDGIAVFNLPGPMSRIKEYDQLTRGAAVYHQSTWDNIITSGLSLTAGLRLDYEKAILDYQYDLIVNENLTPKTSFTNSLEFFEVLPKASVRYRLMDNFSSYFTVSKGYKTGGFNSTFERPEDRTFEPEKSWNYEWGVKSKWMDNRLSANMALFYIDWYDQQIYQPVPSGQGSMLKNAGHSESKGFELELSAIPVYRLKTYASLGYVDARFLEYNEDSTTSFNGNRIPYIPQFTLSVGANYKFYIDSKMLDNISVNINYQGIGKHYWDEENTVEQAYYGLLNGQVGFSTRWLEVGVWGKNLLDANYSAFYFEALGNRYLQQGKPARFGIFVSASF